MDDNTVVARFYVKQNNLSQRGLNTWWTWWSKHMFTHHETWDMHRRFFGFHVSWCASQNLPGFGKRHSGYTSWYKLGQVPVSDRSTEFSHQSGEDELFESIWWVQYVSIRFNWVAINRCNLAVFSWFFRGANYPLGGFRPILWKRGL